MSERTVVLTFIKIFNWNQPKSNPLFEVAFYSNKTNTLILTKTIKTTVTPQEVIFNYSLKVAYQPDEN